MSWPILIIMFTLIALVTTGMIVWMHYLSRANNEYLQAVEFCGAGDPTWTNELFELSLPLLGPRLSIKDLHKATAAVHEASLVRPAPVPDKLEILLEDE